MKPKITYGQVFQLIGVTWIYWHPARPDLIILQNLLTIK